MAGATARLYQATETSRQHTNALISAIGMRWSFDTGLSRLPFPNGFLAGSGAGAVGSGARMGPVRAPFPPPPGINLPGRLMRVNSIKQGVGRLLAKNAFDEEFVKAL
jgi:hypothetical protein